MIRFWEDEYEVSGKDQFIEIHSQWGDLVTFAIAGEQVGERFSDEDPIATYAIDGPTLLDPLRFYEEGIKADWMGKPAGPYSSTFNGSQTEMRCLDFEQDETTVTITLKRYQVGKEEEGHCFSYVMSRADFHTLAFNLASMVQYSL